MLWLELLAWVNSEIKDCEIAMRDYGIDADKWGWRKKAFEDVKKELMK